MTQTTTRHRWLRRAASFVIFRLVPLALLAAAVVVGWGGAQVVARQWQLRQTIEGQRPAFTLTATALAAPQAGAAAGYRSVMFQADDVRRPALQAEATATPRVVPDAFATNTPAVPAAAATEAAAPAIVTAPPLPTLMFQVTPGATASGGTAVPTPVDPLQRDYNLVNILLLGSDDEVTQDNTMRTDVMMIVSVNRDTGTVSMLSLPRDMYVFVPSLGMQRLNVAYGYGEAAEWPAGGFGLLRQVVLYNFGINVHYYALVDLTGFESVIDLVGGVEVGVDCAIQDYFPVEDFDPARPIEENYYLRTLDVGYYTMDGELALWYVRSRRNSSDFDRGRRQQQVLRAVFRQALNNGQVADLPNLWGQGTQLIETNMDNGTMLSLLPVALGLNTADIESFNLVRTYHTQPWTTPDGDNVQLPIPDTIRPFLQDFYTPPLDSTVRTEGASITIFNGTTTTDLDRVAAERLRFDGLNGVAGGAADRADYTDTVLYDYTGATKGSSLGEIAQILNVRPENVIQQPDPNRTTDFAVYLGGNYNSCTYSVLPPEPVATEAAGS